MGSKLSRPPSRPPLPSAIAYKEPSPPPPPPPYQGISDDKDPLRVINAPMVATERKNSISEDALEMLRKYDILVLVDDSGSMSYDGHRSWNEARAALSALAEKAGKYDTDGIDVCFLNSKRAGERLKNAESVLKLFDREAPKGGTPIGDRLEELLSPYIESLEGAKTAKAVNRIKPLDIIVITDGSPTDDPESVIVAAARRLDKGNFRLSQVGIQFVQVGADPKATRFLIKLDDALTNEHGIRDIVDTTPSSALSGALSADNLIKILLGGINRRVDRNGGGSV